ncbi:hypothetical protein EPI10_023741 [Gossypium australe]|uniref:Uncharacterized protein n=1 Tax=Gossypium australe TaxID=47621 RepID=A0A5B6VV36_9ROSI|nr:hypothetical protein EPI10_023741 [Gossypium australe]
MPNDSDYVVLIMQIYSESVHKINISRTEEIRLRSRENESNRVAVSVSVKSSPRSSKLLKARGIVEDRHHTTQLVLV